MTLRAILITLDHSQRVPNAQEVQVAVSEEGDADLHDLYRLIECRSIEVAYCEPDGPFANHLAVMDEEGLFDGSLNGFLACPAIGRQPYAGNVLLLRKGVDDCLASATLALDVVQQAIRNGYVSREFARASIRALEDEAMALYPEAIVVRTSVEL